MVCHRNKRTGFTLIEVLIAATILFATLAVISESYRASMAASRRAEVVARMLTPLPMILKNIRSRLRSNPEESVSGGGEIFGVKYQFSASTARFDAPLPRFDPDSAEFMRFSPRFRLYNVDLIISVEAQERRYSYQELAWSALAVDR